MDKAYLAHYRSSSMDYIELKLRKRYAKTKLGAFGEFTLNWYQSQVI